MSYASAEIEACRARSHTLRAVWSDKTPMKVSLLCMTCSEKSNASVYVAYGDDVQSWGLWKKRSREIERHEGDLMLQQERES